MALERPAPAPAARSIKRRLGVVFAVVVLGLVACAAVGSLSGNDPSPVTDREAVERDLIEAAEANDSILPKDREYVRSLVQVLVDNPYIDRDALYERIRTVEVTYGGDSMALYDEAGLAGGYYNFRDNVLVICVEEYDMTTENSDFFAHELGHLVFAESQRLPTFIKEGAAMCFDAEYYQPSVKEPYLSGWNDSAAAFRALAEVVGRDAILQAVARGDEDVLYEEMARLHGDERQARDVVRRLDSPGPEASLLDLLRPYLDARHGEGWTDRSDMMAAYEHAFQSEYPGEGWPDVYYFNTAK